MGDGSVSRRAADVAISDIVEADDVRLPAFYDLYAGIFTLEEEREPIEGFAKVLRFNHEVSVQAQFGPLREMVTIATEPSTGRIIGGANHVLYAYGETLAKTSGYVASAQLNFLCVDPGFRGLGIAGRLLSELYRKLDLFAQEHGYPEGSPAFVTCEQNNPARMTPEQLEDDLRAAGMDPYERRLWWRKRGYRQLLFDYCQPALSPEHEPCRYIDYFVRTQGATASEPDNLPSSVLREHLRRFFFVSVGKFEVDMSREPNWLHQQATLEAVEAIGIDV